MADQSPKSRIWYGVAEVYVDDNIVIVNGLHVANCYSFYICEACALLFPDIEPLMSHINNHKANEFHKTPEVANRDPQLRN